MRFLKRGLLGLAKTSAFDFIVGRLESIGDSRSDLLRVLTYHRVDEPTARPHLYSGMISATPEQFEQQVEHLARHYSVVAVNDVIDAMAGRRRLPSRAVLITFDDAYCDFAQQAWPALRRRSLPCLMFVPTAFPNQPGQAFWWDRLHVAMTTRRDAAAFERFGTFRNLLRHVKTLPDEMAKAFVDELCHECEVTEQVNPVLGWDDLRRLANDGLDVAPHTKTHPLMTRVPLDQAVRQARDSRADLAREIGQVPPVFAYPGGAYSDALSQRLLDEGFQLAFTTCRGINDLRTADRMKLRRTNVAQTTPNALIRAQLLANSRHLNSCWPLRSAV